MMVWGLAASNKYSLWKSFARMFGKLDVSQLKQFDSVDILVIKGRYNRKDYSELLSDILSRLGMGNSYVDAEKWHTKISIHPLTVFCTYKFVFLKKDVKLKFREKCLLANEMVYYCNTIDSITKIDFKNVTKFLCVIDTLEVENLLTQYFKNKGVKTFSLMEGAYFLFKDNPPFDIIQYENLTTDCKLSWGNYSRDELIRFGINPERLKVAGYPKNVKLYKLKPQNQYKKCMLLLARDSFRESNMCLLEILKNYTLDQEIWLKLHPGCDKSHYQDYADTHNMRIIPPEKTVNECLNQNDFDYAISVNTSAYYEALMRGLPCLRLYDGRFNLMCGLQDSFGNVEEYEDVYSRICNLHSEKYQKEIDDMLKYAVGIGIDNYREIILGKDS